MINLESNETSPSYLAQKLTELWDFKNGLWKKPFLKKRLFKILVIFFTIWNVYLSKFLSFNSTLFCKNDMCYWLAVKMSYKSSDFFQSESMKIWKSNILTLSSKSGCISISLDRQSGPFSWTTPHIHYREAILAVFPSDR